MRGRGFSLSFSRTIYKKRAAAHVEMIGAFTLFFFFVLFLLSVLKPFEVDALSGSVIAGVHDKFEKGAQTNLSKAFVGVNLSEVPAGKSCFYVKLPRGLFAYGLTSSVVYDVDSSVSVDSHLDYAPGAASGDLDVLESPGQDKMGFYEVYISPDFPSGTNMDCEEVTNYKLGGIVDRKVLSQQALMDMNAKYVSDYEGLKHDLGVPPTYDFSIAVEGLPSDFSYTMQGVAPDSGDVFSTEYIKDVLYLNGTVYTAKFRLKIW